MSLKTALYSYLTGFAALNALISTRCYPGVAPEAATRPYMVYNIVSSNHARHMTAASEFTSRNVQIDIYADSALTVESVFDALRDALESKTGTIGTENLSIMSSGIISERDDVTPPGDGRQLGRHRRTIDFEIWHRL